MRLDLLEVVPKPNLFSAEICSCVIPGQVRVIYFFMGALMWTERLRENAVSGRIEFVYQQYLRGKYAVEGRVA